MASTKPTAAVDSQKDSTLLAKSARGASLLIILQIASRGLTFIVNQILLRFLSPQLLAISTQLEVYSITVLLFSRESLRIALQRQPNSSSESNKKDGFVKPGQYIDSRTSAGKSQAIVNLSYISILLGILFSTTLAYLWKPETLVLETPYFKESLIMYAIATFMELLAEPCFIIVQQNSEFGIRARAESVATFLRCIVTCSSAALAAHKGMDIGVLPFALGQWGYAIAIPLIYYWKTGLMVRDGGFSLGLRKIFSLNKSEFLFSYFSTPLLYLGCTLFLQSIIKHFLTQGDTLLISYLASLESQGAFALASNYGGLIARLVFQPIEESSRSYFGKVLASSTTTLEPDEQKEEKPSRDAVKTASLHLHHLLRLYTLLALLTTTTLPTLLPLFLTLLTTSRSPTSTNNKWLTPSTLSTLKSYTHLIPLLSLNGLLESFVTATASPSTLSKQTIFYTAFSIVYIGLSWVFLKGWDVGAKGIVWANMCNMGGRILWSSWWVNGWLRGNGEGKGLDVRSLVPKPMVLASWVGTMSVLAQMQGAEVHGVAGLFMFLRTGTITSELLDLVKVGLVMGGFVIILAISERELLMNAYRSIRSR